MYQGKGREVLYGIDSSNFYIRLALLKLTLQFWSPWAFLQPWFRFLPDFLTRLCGKYKCTTVPRRGADKRSTISELEMLTLSAVY